MEAQIKLGRIFGIEIGLHYSWLVIAFLITLSLAEHFRTTNPQWGAAVIWASAIATGLLGLIRFFGGAGFGGLWIAFIGWFLLDAARASYAQVGIAEALRGCGSAT
jgi:hypothetical protein